MTEKYVLVEYACTINAIIRNTFKGTQRIKLTTFDVSTKYIAFGASSGGIYIFTREPCSFVKLIPSQHGPVGLIAISDNEENVAIATSNGLVVIVENCFERSTFQQQVYIEHEGKTVTDLKWNGVDLYCGDGSGKVSVISTKDFLTKAIFQTPTACLMHLDSSIVQLDTHSKFLLVSTLTRTLLCDTETERYKQIGKKLRDGPFGACFFSKNGKEVSNGSFDSHGGFRTIPDNEQFTASSCEGMEIYCARPGVRLWQADIQASVIFTHQFKGALTQRQSDIIQLDDSSDQLNVLSFDGTDGANDFNFNRIYKVLDRFVLSFKDDGFYIFEPSDSSLAFWCKHYQNIRDIKVLHNFLYIWRNDLEITVLSLHSVEDLIVRTLMRKRYSLCGQLCVRFSHEIEGMIATSRKIHLISILSSKLNNEEDAELLGKLSKIIEKIKDDAKLPLGKIKNGIVTINNAYSLSESKPPTTEGIPLEPLKVSSKETKKSPLDIFREQYRVHQTHRNVQTNDFVNLVESMNLNEIYDLLHEIGTSELSSIWCKEIFLNRLDHTGDFEILTEENKLNFATEAFLTVNNTSNSTCKTCDFPLPNAHKTKPKYYHIGCKLMEKLGDHDNFTKNIPYMHKFNLQKISDNTELKEKLSLVVQYSDEQVVKALSKFFTYDLWDDSLKLLSVLKHGYCSNCGRSIDSKDSLTWKDLCKIMVQSINATNTLKLLERYADLIPNDELDGNFYQFCIFSSSANDTKQLDVIDKMCTTDPEVEIQFDQSVAKFLRRKYLNSEPYTLTTKPPTTILVCDFCSLPLNTPVLDELNKLACGHIYHKICFTYKKCKCCICDKHQ